MRFVRAIAAVAGSLLLTACLEADATMEVHGEDRVDLSLELFVGIMGNVMTREDCSPFAEPHFQAEQLTPETCRIFGTHSLADLPAVLSEYSGKFSSNFALTQTGERYRLEVELERGFLTEAPDGVPQSILDEFPGDGYVQVVLSAGTIASTSGETSNGNQRALIRFDLMSLTEPGNETITHFIEFETTQRPFWQRWFN